MWQRTSNRYRSVQPLCREAKRIVSISLYGDDAGGESRVGTFGGDGAPSQHWALCSLADFFPDLSGVEVRICRIVKFVSGGYEREWSQ